jgi:hypothetical protein
LLVFAIIGPLIYFGPELRAIETGIIDGYRMVEDRLLPVRDWFLELVG